MADHAFFAPSSAAKWLCCPASANLEATLPDTSSSFAAEGTLAHAFCEIELTRKCRALSGAERARFSRLKKDPLFLPEMLECAVTFATTVSDIALAFPSPHIVPESRVDIGGDEYDCWGTSDAILLAGTELHVFDYKHGKGVPVSAENNPQMMLYALGALKKYRMLYNIENVYMHIVQPRINNNSTAKSTAANLMAWQAHEVLPAVAKAVGPNAVPERNAGDWCHNYFCKARATCSEQAKIVGAVADFAQVARPVKTVLPSTGDLTPEQLGELITLAKPFSKWLASAEQHALTLALSGGKIPGYKLVAGRSARVFNDPREALTVLEAKGYPRDMFFEKKQVSVAQSEKIVGKKAFSVFADQIVSTTSGKPTLAPESDKRPEIDSASADFTNLIEEENENV